MKYFIGRNKNNSIVLDFPAISGRHCTIQSTPEGYLIIEDLNSTNNTYINGLPIKAAKLLPSDKLKLADRELEYNWILDTLKKIDIHDKMDFREEFNSLKRSWDEYQNRKEEVEWKFSKKSLLIRSLIMLTPGILCFLFKKQLGGESNAIIGAVFSVLLLMAIMLFEKISKIRKIIEDMDIEFLLTYRCPKCGLGFGNRHWKLIEADRICNNCKAEFV